MSANETDFKRIPQKSEMPATQIWRLLRTLLQQVSACHDDSLLDDWYQVNKSKHLHKTIAKR